MVEFLLDQLGDVDVTARAMFGGHGIYRRDTMFAIVYEESVYMKVSEAEASTSDRPPFKPRDSQTLWSYRSVTADELENRELLRGLAEKAQQAAAS
jgi:DNA transformation protein and related proteins